MEQSVTAGERLLFLAQHFVAQKRICAAALAYITAGTAPSSGLPPKAKAGALVEGAKLLLRDGSAEGLQQARGALLKACLILDGCAGCAQSRLHAGALLETVYARGGERANSVFESCFNVIQSRKSEIPAAWDWWIYFKGREISAAIREATAPGVEAITAASRSDVVIHIAEDAVKRCELNRDPLAAAAFSLIITQLCLGISTRVESPSTSDDSTLQTRPCHLSIGIYEQNNACAENALEYARTTLSETVQTDSNCTDLSLLRLCCVTFESVLQLRSCHMKDSRALGYSLMRAFDAAAQVNRNASSPGQWKWQNGKVLRSLIHFILSAAVRNVGDGADAWQYSVSALQWAGISLDNDDIELNGRVPFQGKLEPFAANTMTVMLLESAARVKLATLHLTDAAPLVSAALSMVQTTPGLSLATQGAAYLLAAEYYMLLGTFESAELATQYLRRVVDSAGENKSTGVELCNIAEMARTYGSLLTGEKRFSSNIGGEFEGGIHARAAALFAEGVYELRQVNVVEAQNALRLAITLVHPDKASSNEQIVANARITLANLHLAHQSIDEDTYAMVEKARSMASESNDIVTLARALRIHRKLLSRSSLTGSNHCHEADKVRLDVETQLHELQDKAPLTLMK